MKKIMIAMAVLVGVAVPVSSFAATYGYINTSGNLATIQANSATEALRLPTDIDPHSGVILFKIPVPVIGSITVTTGTGTSTSVMTVNPTMVGTTTMMVGTSTSATSTSMMMSATSTVR